MEKEPTKDSKEELRELPDDRLQDYSKKYPKNVFVNGEILRRKNSRPKNRRISLVG